MANKTVGQLLSQNRNLPLAVDDYLPSASKCQAILNEAAEIFSRRGTTENFLHILIRLAYRKGQEAAGGGQ